MLKIESIWIKTIINQIEINQNTYILNFGSQSQKTLKYQPYIHYNVIAELQKKGAKIINFDIKEGEGIDISGNIYDYEVFERLKKYNFSYIFLFNVMEHVKEINEFCYRIQNLVKVNNMIIVTVPYDFPYHFDPIDNGLRPNVSELVKYFPNLIMIYGETITDYKYTYYLVHYWHITVRFIFRIFTPFYKFNTWKKTIITKIPYLFKPFKVTCVVLQKR
jgi:hypothetical protein